MWGGVEQIYHLSMNLPKEYHLPAEYDIVSCKNCGFCYADTTAAVQDYDYYYENINFYASKPETAGYEKTLNDWIDIIERTTEKSSCILDMGFGDGRLLLALKQKGFDNIVGVDTTAEGVALLQNKGVNAYVGSIYDEPAEEMKQKADVLIMSGVFEHLLLPCTALSNVKKWLKRGGKLVCLVPDMDNLATTTLPISYFFHHEHINYFTRNSLKYFMSREGYKECFVVPQFDQYGNMVAVFEYLGESVDVAKDFSGADILRRYFEREQASDARRYRLIEQLVESRQPLILYGCGSMLQKMWAETKLREGNIVALVDKNIMKVRNMNMGGFHIISPEQLAQKHIDGTICIFCAKGSDSILHDISTLGIYNEVVII